MVFSLNALIAAYIKEDDENIFVNPELLECPDEMRSAILVIWELGPGSDKKRISEASDLLGISEAQLNSLLDEAWKRIR